MWSANFDTPIVVKPEIYHMNIDFLLRFNINGPTLKNRGHQKP
jgi:hypothetical protein